MKESAAMVPKQNESLTKMNFKIQNAKEVSISQLYDIHWSLWVRKTERGSSYDIVWMYTSIEYQG